MFLVEMEIMNVKQAPGFSWLPDFSKYFVVVILFVSLIGKYIVCHILYMI